MAKCRTTASHVSRRGLGSARLRSAAKRPAERSKGSAPTVSPGGTPSRLPCPPPREEPASCRVLAEAPGTEGAAATGRKSRGTRVGWPWTQALGRAGSPPPPAGTVRDAKEPPAPPGGNSAADRFILGRENLLKKA